MTHLRLRPHGVTGPVTPLRLLAVLVVALAAFVYAPIGFAASSTLMINEVDYDQPSTDTTEFYELKNVSGGPINLDNYRVEGINGNGGGPPSIPTSTCPTSTSPRAITSSSARTPHRPELRLRRHARHGSDSERRAGRAAPPDRDDDGRRAQLRRQHGRRHRGDRRPDEGTRRPMRACRGAPTGRTRTRTASTSCCGRSRLAPPTPARARRRRTRALPSPAAPR